MYLFINVYNSGDGVYNLYEDDGESIDYISGKGAVTKMVINDKMFTIYPAEGDINLLPQSRTYTICFEFDIDGYEVLVNGKRVEVQGAENTLIIEKVKPTDKAEIRINL